MGEWVNVKTDYAAVADGIVDDFTKVQNAVTAAASDGKVVYFP
jgi:polygalacturonase